MSSNTLHVRFPDGTIRYGILYDTIGLAQPNLYATEDEAWDWWDTYRQSDFDAALRRQTTAVGEPVDISDYWKHWQGRATHDVLLGELDTFAITDAGHMSDGMPVWLGRLLAEQQGISGPALEVAARIICNDPLGINWDTETLRTISEAVASEPPPTPR